MRFSGEHDPFEQHIRPPRDETPAAKAQREAQQAEAQRINDSIDEQIKRERVALKKEKNSVKIMLVGQSDSGKSTTLKNFRLKYARQAWDQERSSWRAVIQLNLVSNVMVVIEALYAEMNNLPLAFKEGDEYFNPQTTPIQFTDNHQLLLLRLGPLRQVEADLKQRLGVLPRVSPVSQKGPSRPGSGSRSEVSVRSWGSFFEVISSENSSSDVIAGCREDIKALWTDKNVQHALKKRRITLQNQSGFFMDDVDRIACRGYVPSDDDILRARLRTNGIQEYRLQVNMSTAPAPPVGRDFLLYDVGGCRTQRAAWQPFFEGINALLVLVPVDCFDECLEEAPDVNKLQDSFLIWEQLCSSQLLKKATIILFLNKYDLLQEKMNTGIQINRYLTSYSKPNTPKSFVKYLQNKFSDRLQHKSPQPRNSYAYITSVVDSKATSVTLSSVRDSIKRDHLANSSFL